VLDLGDVEKGSLHGLLTRDDRPDQIVDLLEELVVAHHSDDLLIVGLSHIAVARLLVRARLSHVRMGLKGHLIGHLVDYRALFKRVSIGVDRGEVKQSASRVDNFAAACECLASQDHTFFNNDIFVDSRSRLNHTAFLDNDVVANE